MPVDRRRFVRQLILAPAIPAGLAAQEVTTQTPPKGTQNPEPQPNTPARQIPKQPDETPLLKTTAADLSAATELRFFTAVQFAALRKLAGVLVPAIKGNPSALEAGAPEFLDFLIGVSPADRQILFRHGLDELDKSARARFAKTFGDLDDAQVATIVRPLLVARPWPHDLPSDPLQSFLAQVHDDLRTATTNSREYAAAQKAAKRSSRARLTGMYWKPVDPVTGA